MRGTPLERFMAKTERHGDCLAWTGGRNSNGHGTFYIGGRIQTARRSSWLLHFGQIDGDQGVIATCTTDQCVEPTHLRLTNVGPVARSLAERLWPQVDTSSGPDACWPFTGSKNRGGYGAIRDETGKTIRSHRAAWIITNGPIPDGIKVRHFICDNPPCCNPTHLLLGTQMQNIADMHDHGRDRKADRDGNNRNAKLTSAQVEEIRSRYVFRKVTHKMLAAEYGVDRTTIQRLFDGRP